MNPHNKFLEFLEACETECTDLVLKNYCKITFDELWFMIYTSQVTPLRYQDWLDKAKETGYAKFNLIKDKTIKIKFSQEYKLNENINKRNIKK